MPNFRVKCFSAGIWDAQQDREVLADTAQSAAEQVCECSLMENGPLGKLRAEVWEQGELPVRKVFFYGR